jgi:signal transduction histidine kinase
VEFSVSYEQYVEGMNAEEREQADRNLEAMIEKEAPFHTVHHFNYIPSNPEPCWYLLHGLPVRDAQGVITGYFGLARDITHLMEAQERLRQETERAENSGRLKSAFLANMTHEIRTPLNAIVGFSGLLQMIDVPEERKEFIRIIRNNCDMLLRLINDILEASSMGQSMAIEPEPLDLAVVFDDICQTLEQRVQESGVPFIKDNPYDTFPAVLDKGRLQQILTNFVTNAVKYTHEGHIRVGYRSEARNGEEGLYFYCEDTGAGIPKEKQDAVFERFVKLNDYVQGTGLGLSICKSIVERCDGDIGVYSEGEGHGSTFWFWVPLKN